MHTSSKIKLTLALFPIITQFKIPLIFNTENLYALLFMVKNINVAIIVNKAK